MSTSRRHLLLCASILGVGTLSGTAFAAPTTQPEHRSHKAVHHKAAPAVTTASVAAKPVVAAPVTTPSVAVPASSKRKAKAVFAPAAVEGGSESMVVTGSALRSSNNQNANPVQIVTSKQIQMTGATSVGDFLQRLPSMGSGGTYNSSTNGGGGMSCADLRNLGQQRVLVLIDGKRTTLNTNGTSSCVDMNTIPVQAIASIEVLKDGGSELYGADAVSGVINIKLKHNLNTGNITLHGGISDLGDGKNGQISAYKGWNFDHDKGNLTLFAQYQTNQGVMNRNRDWAYSAAQNNPGAGGTVKYGSAIPPNGQIGTADGNYAWSTSNNGTQFHNWSNSDRYNFARQSSLLNSWQDATANGDFHYDFNRHLTVYANAMYSHRTSSTFMAAEPTSGSVPPSTLPNVLTIPANDPYNPTVTGANGLYSGDPQDVQLYRRLTEMGNRRTETSSDTVTGMFGAKGEITHKWMYDVSYTYGNSQMADVGENMGNYQHLLNTYGIQQLDPSDPNSGVTYNPAVCQASAGCTLSTNPFGKLTPEQIKYVNYNTHDNATYQMRDLNVRINNNDVVKMPWANGGRLGIALGMEHRSEQLSYHPDPLAAAGLSMTNPSGATGGGFSVSEAYLEGRLNLLHNAPFAKDLTIDGQGRFSSYSNVGDTKNWKTSINWQPVRDVHFRATLGTSFRQPNVYELYGGQYLNYLPGADPCTEATSPTVIANCMKHGVSSPQTMQDVNSGQIPSLTGGNAKLKPETGRTYTFGAEFTPHWIPGLSASIEYWHYTLKNLISPLSPQYIVNQCYQAGNESYCSDINRSSISQQINDVSTFYVNQGGLKTGGIDFDLDYRIRVTPHDVLTISNNFQQLISYLQQFQAGGQWDNLAGRLMYTTGNGQPRVRDYATATWQHGNFSFTYMMNYTGGMMWNDGETDLAAYNRTNPGTYGRVKTPGIFTHDISVGYRYNDWNFTGGVNNLLDKNPPYVVDGSTNSAQGLYGSMYMGRYAWLQISRDF